MRPCEGTNAVCSCSSTPAIEFDRVVSNATVLVRREFACLEMPAQKIGNNRDEQQDLANRDDPSEQVGWCSGVAITLWRFACDSRQCVHCVSRKGAFNRSRERATHWAGDGHQHTARQVAASAKCARRVGRSFGSGVVQIANETAGVHWRDVRQQAPQTLHHFRWDFPIHSPAEIRRLRTPAQ